MEDDLLLTRWIFTKKSTVGVFTHNDIFICNSIEDPDRGLRQEMTAAEIINRKVYGVTCIPYGRYEIRMLKSASLSIKKGKDISVPFLMDVPGFSAIEIHPANFASQLRGCIGPGIYDPGKIDAVWFSKQSYQKLLLTMEDILSRGKLYIRIVKSQKPINQ